MKKKLLFFLNITIPVLLATNTNYLRKNITLNSFYNANTIKAYAALQPKVGLNVDDGQIYPSGSTIDIRGWAINSSGVKAVDVYIDEKYTKTLSCNLYRSDVQNAFPQYPNKANSGYDYKTTLSDGKHTIRVYNIGNDGQVIYTQANITVNNSQNNNLQPKIGLNIDNGQTYSSGSSVDIRGWALNSSGVRGVDVYIDGNYTKTLACNLSRPDVQAAFPQYSNAANSGYDYKIALSAGQHTIRVYDIGNDGNVIYTEVTVTVNASQNANLQPRIGLNINNGQTYSSGSSVDIRGWALNSSGVRAADVYIDGKYTKTLACNLSRPDVQAAFPQYLNAANSGFDYKIVLSSGEHTIRVYDIGNDGRVIYTEANITVNNSQNNNLQPKIGLNIDNGQACLNGSTVDIRGWAINSTPVKYVDLYIDDKYVKTLDCNLPRPDVKNVFPNYPNAENSGYEYSLDTSKYDIGNHVIKTYAIGNNGSLISTSSTISVQPSNIITYKDSIAAADRVYSGLQFITDPTTGIPHANFDYSNKSEDSHAGFNIGLATISTYMATGDIKYLNTAKTTADFLNKVLPSTGLVPEYSIVYNCIDKNSTTSLGTSGQSTALEFISYLARIDSSYIPLMNKLANGLINYGLNKNSNLCWSTVCTSNGEPVSSSSYTFESQSGSVSSSCAEALLAAYETDNANIEFKNKAIDILKSIWNTRNPLTNLIPETWNISTNTIGTHLYPYGDFRYDDMGGAYIRALMLGYNVTKNSDLFNILKTYVPSLANAVWDSSLNGGAFRYLTNINGGRTSLVNVETMHGLFISTLLEADSMIGPNNGDILNKAKSHADHILMTDFGVKNFMVPHQISSSGTYINSASDSQLGYAVLQYPLGYELLSQKTGDNKYRLRDNQIFNALLSRHKIGDNISSPEGYLNIVETQPPYGFEYSYSSPSWMLEALYVPSYLLFNSIHPSSGVTIDWQHGSSPSTFGLVYDMPFWDLNNVKVQGKNLHLGKVSGGGTIDLTDMGFGNIKSIKCDGNNYSNFNNSVLNTETGTHSYDISWDN